MRPNSLKAKLRAGQRVVGALITINSPELVETFGHLGYDFVFIDGQHGGLGVETARELIRAAELTGMTPLVRVRKNDPAEILEYLDQGAGGVIVPDVTSRADVEAAAKATRYPTRGVRGAMGDVPRRVLRRAAGRGRVLPAGGRGDPLLRDLREPRRCSGSSTPPSGSPTSTWS